MDINQDPTAPARRRWRDRVPSIRRATAGTIAVAAGCAVALAVVSSSHPASAASSEHGRLHRASECRTWSETLDTYPLETRYRVGAECSYVNPNEKARGVLDMKLRTDGHTAWFTDVNVTHYSDWYTPLVGTPDTRMEFAAR